ncbi:MAG TPA: DUF72 domain-containing protein [Gemmatimonadales bacterium]|nr:DUF72 domain-containing protein [Gemmatimonadales bacterium]
MGALLVGTQGWNYRHWVGPFYPHYIRPEDYLRSYARAFGTVEVDSTFYAVPPEDTVKGWAAKVPEQFRFACKLPQEATHERKLVDAHEVLDEFTTRMRTLGNRLGPILIQLGPEFGPEYAPALERFLPLLPPDLRFAVEFRRRGWLRPPILRRLAEHGVAVAMVEGRWLPREAMLRLAAEPTADFAYVRLMGPDRSIVDYSRVQVDRTAELEAWVPALRALADRLETVYVYVNNHFEGHSPSTARRLQKLLGQAVVEPDQLADQGELF